MDIKEIKVKIELAILANGGENHRKKWCQCDPSVGYTPCEYCAVFNGLNSAKDLISEYEKLKTETDKRKIKLKTILNLG